MKMILPPPVLKALERLEQEGYEAFVVGGCVRDSLISKVPDDWDICTNALPDEIKHCFSMVQTIDTGLKYGTVTVVIDHMMLQITTYRLDLSYSDYRRPDHVAFTPSLEEDCRRRDFTVNAMAYNPKTGLVDFFGGLEDLSNKKIRCVGDANKRFSEDALRILRALRFSSVLCYEIEENTVAAIHQNKQLLQYISSERILSEINKLLFGMNVEHVLRAYPDVFEVFLPEVSFLYEKKDSTGSRMWDHIASSIGKASSKLSVRTALLFHEMERDPGESALIAQRTLERWKADKDGIRKTALLVENQCVDLCNSRKGVLKLFKRFGPDHFMNLLDLKEACLKARGNDPERLFLVEDCRRIASDVLSRKDCWSIAQLEVNGHDLINAGIKEGRMIGETLDLLTDMVIEGRVKNSKEDLIRCIAQMKTGD